MFWRRYFFISYFKWLYFVREIVLFVSCAKKEHTLQRYSHTIGVAFL
jgi:hypothetical protein